MSLYIGAVLIHVFSAFDLVSNPQAIQNTVRISYFGPVVSVSSFIIRFVNCYKLMHVSVHWHCCNHVLSTLDSVCKQLGIQNTVKLVLRPCCNCVSSFVIRFVNNNAASYCMFLYIGAVVTMYLAT